MGSDRSWIGSACVRIAPGSDRLRFDNFWLGSTYVRLAADLVRLGIGWLLVWICLGSDSFWFASARVLIRIGFGSGSDLLGFGQLLVAIGLGSNCFWFRSACVRTVLHLDRVWFG